MNTTIMRNASLKYKGCTAISQLLGFVVAEKYVVDTEPEAKVKISYVSPEFNCYFRTKIERPTQAQVLDFHQLEEDSSDSLILSLLGGDEKVQVTLSQIFTLLEEQGNGEKEGTLSVTHSNIFYVLDSKNILRTVILYWDIDGWDINTHSVPRKYNWRKPLRIFSRKIKQKEDLV